LIRTRLFAEEARYKNLLIDSIGLDRIRLATEKAIRQELYNSVINQIKLVFQIA